MNRMGAWSFSWQIATLLTLFVCGNVGALSEQTGKFPIAVPDYAGVEQLLVLSDRWVIVVTTPLPVVLAEIDRLSGGEFKPAVDAWEETRVKVKPKWQLRKVASKIRDTYIAQARENVGERQLGTPGNYSISSDDDARYAVGQPPSKASGALVSMGGTRFPGAHEVDYTHYAFLAFPEPMQSGKHYTITFREKDTATFLFDNSRTVSRAIKVNQVGYLPSATRKFAYLGAHLYEAGPLDCSMYPEFEVVDVDTGEVAFRGPVTMRDKDAWLPQRMLKSGAKSSPRKLHGEDLYELDFSGLTKTGHFFIRIPGVGRSWPFRHADDAYGAAFYTAARGLYHQRCGIACEAPYTAWPHVECHTGPVYESDHVLFPRGEVGRPKEYERFDVIGATLDTSRKTVDARGGWHDAADWDRNANHYTVVFDLLYAYELAPKKFRDGQLNIPESGNGIPDVLDEADYGLKVWEKSMNTEGGVAGQVETWTHPRIDADIDYAYSRRTRWDSLLFAAGAAQLSQHLRPFAPARSAALKEAALKAYAYGANPAHSLGKVTFQAKKNRGRGEPYTVDWEEKETYIAPYLVHAKVRLFRLTDDESYLAGISRLLAAPFRPYIWPCTYADYSPWIFFSMVRASESFLPALQQKKMEKEYFLDAADTLVTEMNAMPYRHSWQRDKGYGMGWGASVMTNPARALLIAHTLTGDAKYRDAAVQNIDFMFGANPMGISWTTGIGYVYPIDIQHENSQSDGIVEPVPGITVYGITGGTYPAMRNKVWKSPGGTLSKEPVVFQDLAVPLWRTWECHPMLNTAECEFTIQETMSSTIFCAALMLPDDWMPDSALLERKPRDPAMLHGRWYLP